MTTVKRNEYKCFRYLHNSTKYSMKKVNKSFRVNLLIIYKNPFEFLLSIEYKNLSNVNAFLLFQVKSTKKVNQSQTFFRAYFSNRGITRE